MFDFNDCMLIWSACLCGVDSLKVVKTCFIQDVIRLNWKSTQCTVKSSSLTFKGWLSEALTHMPTCTMLRAPQELVTFSPSSKPPETCVFSSVRIQCIVNYRNRKKINWDKGLFSRVLKWTHIYKRISSPNDADNYFQGGAFRKLTFSFSKQLPLALRYR